jgi:hypothetical protein
MDLAVARKLVAALDAEPARRRKKREAARRRPIADPSTAAAAAPASEVYVLAQMCDRHAKRLDEP